MGGFNGFLGSGAFGRRSKGKQFINIFMAWMEGAMGSLPDMEEKRKIGMGMEIEMNQGATR
jgi:hypothetical protein